MVEFDESKHKRDKDGKFAKQNERKVQELEKKYNDDLAPAPMRPEKAYGFANKERKETAHHKAHAKEMGFKNQDEYERAACEFFNSNQGKLYYERRRKRFYRYDEKSKKLAVSSDGIIHTFSIYTVKEFARIKKQEGLYEQNN